MKRRTALQHLASAAAVAWILPSCISDHRKVSIALNHLQVNGEEEDLLALIAETIIPETDTPGARTVGAHHFTLVMVDDCLPKDQQLEYLKGMRSFSAALKKITGDNFEEVSAQRREEMVLALEEKIETVSPEIRLFWQKTRGYVLQGYTSSQYFLTEVKPYQLIPGPNYRGCVHIPQPSTIS